MRITSEMEKDPTAEKITVYREFVAKLLSTKKQSEVEYHGDRYLRDNMMT